MLQEIRDGRSSRSHGARIAGTGRPSPRVSVRRKGLKKGDRCALLAHNSIRLGRARPGDHGRRPDRGSALRAPGARGTGRHDEGLLARTDLLRRCRVARRHSCKTGRRRLHNICSTKSSRMPAPASAATRRLADSDPVTIIYTSGTSGEAKGVVLTAGNIGHMLGCTSGAARSADGEASRAGPRVPLPAVLFCRLVDHAADLPAARAACSR